MMYPSVKGNNYEFFIGKLSDPNELFEVDGNRYVQDPNTNEAYGFFPFGTQSLHFFELSNIFKSVNIEMGETIIEKKKGNSHEYDLFYGNKQEKKLENNNGSEYYQSFLYSTTLKNLNDLYYGVFGEKLLNKNHNGTTRQKMKFGNKKQIVQKITKTVNSYPKKLEQFGTKILQIYLQERKDLKNFYQKWMEKWGKVEKKDQLLFLNSICSDKNSITNTFEVLFSCLEEKIISDFNQIDKYLTQQKNQVHDPKHGTARTTRSTTRKRLRLMSFQKNKSFKHN
ncbi:hypothetical protein M0813_16316 [Anaeramoeba flamelloides]|uniref:Uncharacterized protein n=1 Tax=Anaeramoeba flamelloides TaxID=1746091 RepID=A0ABQ8Z0B4_9EUKA|nr:hypothetical protein M0813_16316 [Anaeramoeba flamelloides]